MGFSELLLIALIGLVVIGPKRLPETVRTLAMWIGRLRSLMSSARSELEREFGVDEVRQQLHNERIMNSLDKKINPLSSLTSKPSPSAPTNQSSEPEPKPEPPEK